jgi:hypothetical protein
VIKKRRDNKSQEMSDRRETKIKDTFLEFWFQKIQDYIHDIRKGATPSQAERNKAIKEFIAEVESLEEKTKERAFQLASKEKRRVIIDKLKSLVVWKWKLPLGRLPWLFKNQKNTPSKSRIKSDWLLKRIAKKAIAG